MCWPRSARRSQRSAPARDRAAAPAAKKEARLAPGLLHLGLHASPACSALGDDDLEILARNDHGCVAGCVEACNEIEEIARERLAAGLIERLESLEHRSVISL